MRANNRKKKRSIGNSETKDRPRHDDEQNRSESLRRAVAKLIWIDLEPNVHFLSTVGVGFGFLRYEFLGGQKEGYTRLVGE